MIIKSLSRKGGAGAFSQLYDYITHKAHQSPIWHNFFGQKQNRHTTLQEFEQNAQCLKNRSKRYNVCYHEILSIQRDPSRGQDFENRQIQALRDLTRQYLAARAPGQLAYAALHLDQQKSIHVHIIISANSLKSAHRVKLPKHEFLQIQKHIERQLHAHHPEFGEKMIYNKPWEFSQKFSNKEEQMMKRTQAPSNKMQMKRILEEVFASSTTHQQAVEVLKSFKITLTSKGKNITASHGSIKCRLKTLGLEQAYENIGQKQEFQQRHRGQKFGGNF